MTEYSVHDMFFPDGHPHWELFAAELEAEAATAEHFKTMNYGSLGYARAALRAEQAIVDRELPW